MARRGRKTTPYYSKRRNVKSSTFTTRSVFRPLTILPTLATVAPYYTTQKRRAQIDGDRRRFDPTRTTESPAAVSRRDAQLTIPRLRNPFNTLPSNLAFRNPDRVALCRRRRTRKRVLFAISIAGKRGVGAGRSKRRGLYSNISCQG